MMGYVYLNLITTSRRSLTGMMLGNGLSPWERVLIQAGGISREFYHPDQISLLSENGVYSHAQIACLEGKWMITPCFLVVSCVLLYDKP